VINHYIIRLIDALQSIVSTWASMASYSVGQLNKIILKALPIIAIAKWKMEEISQRWKQR
jgi:hypothetical protein